VEPRKEEEDVEWNYYFTAVAVVGMMHFRLLND
jgi:hypothetical protein